MVTTVRDAPRDTRKLRRKDDVVSGEVLSASRAGARLLDPPYLIPKARIRFSEASRRGQVRTA